MPKTDTIISIQTKVEDLFGQFTGYGNRRNGLIGSTKQMTQVIRLRFLNLKPNSPPPPSMRVQFSSRRVGNHTLTALDRGIENIDFESGEVRRAVLGLIGDGPDIPCVIGVRPL